MEITGQQANHLQRAYLEFGAVLKELGILEGDGRPPDPRWVRDTAKQWGLLNALAVEHQGNVGSDDWASLGRQHGYDPRGLGGFFVGAQPLMASHGARRVLTEHGRRFIERWRGDFDV